MQKETEAIRDAILADAPAEDIAKLPLPSSMRAITTHRDDVEALKGVPADQRDPRKTLHVDEVPLPEVGPGEALVAIMAGAVNYNTVWASIFEPVPTFGMLDRLAKTQGSRGAKHALPYHIQGSDGAGVVVKVGEGVTRWKPGDRVNLHTMYHPMEDPQGHNDGMKDPEQRVYAYETNFGTFADFALVQANQLMRKPEHLTWEEAGSLGLVNTTVYRMLVGHHGARMRQGDVVLIWGAATGVGGFATQYVLNGGGIPVCVVSDAERVEAVKKMGAKYVIDRRAEGFEFWKDGKQDFSAIRAFGNRIRELTGGYDPDIVVEHPGRATFGASVYVAAKGGKIVTVASTSGYTHEFDNRFLWINLKQIIGSHLGNYDEGYKANRLVDQGMIHPMLSKVYPLEKAGEAVATVRENTHSGKLGLLSLAPDTGLGVRNAEKRAELEPELAKYR